MITNTVQHEKKNRTTVTPAMRLAANAAFWANRTIFQFLILSLDWEMNVLKRSFCFVLPRWTVPSPRPWPCLFSLRAYSSPSPFSCFCRSLWGMAWVGVRAKSAIPLMPIIPKYFCTVWDHAGKADLSKAYWNPKRKLVVTTHFSEII